VCIWSGGCGGSGEIGPALTLPNGQAFFLGGDGLTVYYQPSGNLNNGTWTQGPTMPLSKGGNQLETQDSFAAMMVNGKILCVLSDMVVGEIYFYEFDSVNGFIKTSGPNDPDTDMYIYNHGYGSGSASMLDLPDGTVLYSDSSEQLYVYRPDTAPLASGTPVINSIAYKSDGSLHITGTLFNGISEGASEGDDAQMDSNYPLVRFTDGSGHVYYGRTYNWSSTGIQTGTKIVTTECTLPAGIYNGLETYSLQVVANGNASAPWTPFYGPDWVDFTSTCTDPIGDFGCVLGTLGPYPTLNDGANAVPSGGTIFVKPGSSTEHMPLTITKAMTIIAPLGAATVGQ